ncbi:MAG: polysaccharide pyruvyl transferase family protein [Acidobacteriota bacterium]|nr:polysaccharide pyruvyl transferase family protein [Acidobacteriota bacterium]
MNCIREEALREVSCGGAFARICLLGASRRTGNLGVNALAAGAVTALLANGMPCELGWLDYGRELAPLEVRTGGGRVKVNGIAIRFSKRLWQPNHIVRLLATAWLARALPEKQRERLIGGNRWLRELARFDVAAALSGGDSFSDLYGMRRFLYIALPMLLMLALRVRLVLLPQTIGPFRGRVARWLARAIVRRAERICGRDPQSAAWAQQQLDAPPEGQVKFCPDVAFVLETRRPKSCEELLEELAESPRPVVGLNVSGLLCRGNNFGLAVDYPRVMREVAEYFVRREDALLVLVPHVRAAGEDDLAAACELASVLGWRWRGQVRVLNQPLDESEVKYAIGRMDFFVGSRMHACIAALSQAVPAVGLAYSGKFAGVFSAAGAGELALDLRCSTMGQVLAGVQRAYAARVDWHKRLAKNIPQLREEVFALFADLNSVPRKWPQTVPPEPRRLPKHAVGAWLQ